MTNRASERATQWQQDNPERVKTTRQEHYNRTVRVPKLIAFGIEDAASLSLEEAKAGMKRVYADRSTKRRKEYKEKQRLEGKKYIWEYKKAHPCIQCQESHPACLTFHHRDKDRKKDVVCQLTKYGIKTVKAEIEKCDVLCHNCHMKSHWENGDLGTIFNDL